MLFFTLLFQLLAQSDVPYTAKSPEPSAPLQFTEFMQVYPALSAPATEETRVQVEQMDDHIKITVTAFQKRESVFASVLGRDEDLSRDDFIEVIIDSYNQHNFALGFQTNALGTRRDYELANNGGSRNVSWNTFWNARATVHEDRWEAIYEIPFTSLPFTSGETVTMGLKVNRFVKAKNEKSTMPKYEESVTSPDYNLTVTAPIEFENLASNSPLYITPYIISNFSEENTLNDAETAYENSSNFQDRKNYLSNKTLDQVLSNIGFDAKYKINNSTTLDLTVNTDFAQAEADDRQVNLSRFSLFVPEKRRFFLENANMFELNLPFNHRLFHSRSIGIEESYDEDKVNTPLVAGGRITGNNDGLKYGVLTMQSGEMEADSVPSINYSVMRLRQQIGNDDSYIGGIITGKHSADGSYNRLVAIDNRYRISKTMVASGFFSQSFEDTSPSKTLAYGAQIYQFPNEGYMFNLEFAELQENFNPELGFLTRSESKQLGTWNGYVWRFEDSFVTEYRTGVWHGRAWNSTSGKQSFMVTNIWNSLLFSNGMSIRGRLFGHEQDVLDESWEFNDDLEIPIGTYERSFFALNFNTGNAFEYNSEFRVEYGGYYGGTLLRLSPKVNYIVNAHFNFDVGLDYSSIEFPAKYSSTGDGKVKRIVMNTRLNYAFNSSSSIKLFLQYDNKNEVFSNNLRLRYNPSEGTDLYFVYNSNFNADRESEDVVKPRLKNQAVIMKFSRTLTF